MAAPFLLPDGEVAEGVSALLPNLAFTLFSSAATGDTDGVEFYVPPYLGGQEVLDVLARLPDLRVVQALTAGIDWLAPAVPPGVTLCNARGVHEASTAELAVAGILAIRKRLQRFVRLQDQRSWAHERVGSLAGSRAVVLGQGAIGSAVSARLAAFDVTVTGVTRSGSDGTIPLAALPPALERCDILVVTLPLTSESEGLVDAAVLRALPDSALVVSVARGPVVDTDALTGELVSGRLLAFLDVTDPEPLPADHVLWSLPNVLITPHVGGDTDAFPGLAARLVADQIGRYVEGRPLEHVVTGDY